MRGLLRGFIAAVAVVLCCAGLLRAWDVAGDPLGSVRADRVHVSKRAHLLTLFRNGAPLKSYKVALGRGGLEPKQKAGDNKVPEGVYRIVSHNAQSGFHRSLRIGYPTSQQMRAAHAEGAAAGGDVMIHGLRNGLGWLGPLQRTVDWTKGCIGVTDREMDDIYRAVPDGTTIEIRP